MQPKRAKGIPSPLLPFFFCCPYWAATTVLTGPLLPPLLGHCCHPYWATTTALIGPSPPFLGCRHRPSWPLPLSRHCYCLLEPLLPFLLPSSRPYFLGLMASPRPIAKGKQIFIPCTYCGKTTHASKKCWNDFGKPGWAHAMFSSITPSPTPPNISMPPVGRTIQMTFTPTEYEAWKQSQASTSTANLVSTSDTHAFLACRSSWVIDSGASAHMTRIPSTLSSLTPTTTYPPLSITDGRSCSVKGYGSTKPTPSLTLHNVLYVAGFPTNLLSISTITGTLNCIAIFYPFHCVF